MIGRRVAERRLLHLRRRRASTLPPLAEAAAAAAVGRERHSIDGRRWKRRRSGGRRRGRGRGARSAIQTAAAVVRRGRGRRRRVQRMRADSSGRHLVRRVKTLCGRRIAARFRRRVQIERRGAVDVQRRRQREGRGEKAQRRRRGARRRGGGRRARQQRVQIVVVENLRRLLECELVLRLLRLLLRQRRRPAIGAVLIGGGERVLKRRQRGGERELRRLGRGGRWMRSESGDQVFAFASRRSPFCSSSARAFDWRFERRFGVACCRCRRRRGRRSRRLFHLLPRFVFVIRILRKLQEKSASVRKDEKTSGAKSVNFDRLSTGCGRSYLHVELPQMFGARDKRRFFGVGEAAPPRAELLGDFGVVHVGRLLADFAPLLLRPSHERVHRPLNVRRRLAAVGRVSVGRCGGRRLQSGSDRFRPTSRRLLTGFSSATPNGGCRRPNDELRAAAVDGCGVAKAASS